MSLEHGKMLEDPAKPLAVCRVSILLQFIGQQVVWERKGRTCFLAAGKDKEIERTNEANTQHIK